MMSNHSVAIIDFSIMWRLRYNAHMGILLPIGNQNYGFVDAVPAARRYAITGDYMTIARNHCAATMLTNAVMLLAPTYPKVHDPQALFREIHDFIGNGPVLRLQNKTNRYLMTARLPYTCRQVNRGILESSPARLVSLAHQDLAAGRPAALLVAASPLRWHWVLALPEAPTQQAHSLRSADAFTIIDNWHPNCLYHYVPDQGAHLMAICLFPPQS